MPSSSPIVSPLSGMTENRIESLAVEVSQAERVPLGILGCGVPTLDGAVADGPQLARVPARVKPAPGRELADAVIVGVRPPCGLRCLRHVRVASLPWNSGLLLVSRDAFVQRQLLLESHARRLLTTSMLTEAPPGGDRCVWSEQPFRGGLGH